MLKWSKPCIDCAYIYVPDNWILFLLYCQGSISLGSFFWGGGRKYALGIGVCGNPLQESVSVSLSKHIYSSVFTGRQEFTQSHYFVLQLGKIWGEAWVFEGVFEASPTPSSRLNTDCIMYWCMKALLGAHTWKWKEMQTSMCSWCVYSTGYKYLHILDVFWGTEFSREDLRSKLDPWQNCCCAWLPVQFGTSITKVMQTSWGVCSTTSPIIHWHSVGWVKLWTEMKIERLAIQASLL